MKQSQFNKLEMMMLADSNRNVVFGNELMVDDNFDMPLSKEDRDKYMAPVYPFKLMFMMIMICTKGYMRFQCNLQERTVKAGEVMILFPNSIGECLDTSPDFQGFLHSHHFPGYGHTSPETVHVEVCIGPDE